MSKENIETKNQNPKKEDDEKKIKELEKVISELKDSMIRLLADSENERKRHAKNLEEMRKYANKKLIQRMLPFLDNYKQALELSEKMKDPKINSFLLGFEMMLKEFWNIMEAEKVEEVKITPEKDLWDSNYHEVIEEVENDKYPSGTVLEVKQKGYLLDKQLLRPARIKVSKKVANEEKKK